MCRGGGVKGGKGRSASRKGGKGVARRSGWCHTGQEEQQLQRDAHTHGTPLEAVFATMRHV